MTLPPLSREDLPGGPAGVTAWLAAETASTMDDVRELGRSGAPDFTCVRAIVQTGGRGRLGRAWQSPPGNLYLSVLLRRLGGPGQPVHQLGFVAAVALADAVSALPGLSGAVRLKWPNDLLLDGAKVAGLLLETGGGGTEAPWCVLGLGLNVANHPEGLPYSASSLAAAGYGGDPAACAAAFLTRFSMARDAWRAEGFSPVRAAWLAYAQHHGQVVRVQTAAGMIAGRFDDLDDSGALVLDTDAGRRVITAGEVTAAGTSPGSRRDMAGEAA
ncbi:MAG: biotin--[acetyl-CoA-carboxylase] ligase [Alphaproteobacteria bacterium]